MLIDLVVLVFVQTGQKSLKLLLIKRAVVKADEKLL
jgi:hypothetical protein